MARKRLLLPFGAAEADEVLLEAYQGFRTEYGQPEVDFVIELRGNPATACLPAFTLREGRIGVFVPFGTPVEVVTL